MTDRKDQTERRASPEDRARVHSLSNQLARGDESGPADIPAASAGPEAIAASGAIQEPEVAASIDVDHPAVDNNPRAGTTANQNLIEFNDPGKGSREAVAENLGYEQPKPGEDGAERPAKARRSRPAPTGADKAE